MGRNVSYLLIGIHEINCLSQLDNKNIIHLFDIYVSKKNQIDIFIIMEFCDFKLSKLIKIKKYDGWIESEINFFFKQLLKGLFSLHDKGFLHCDVKPANILITRNRILKIIDFGLTIRKLT